MEKMPENETKGGNSDEDEYSDAKEPYDESDDVLLNTEEHDLDEECLVDLFKDKTEVELQALSNEVAALKQEGNDHFKKSEFAEAITMYTRALNTCPVDHKSDRSILYANRAAARINLDLKEEAVLDCNKAIDLNPEYLKALLRRAQLHQKLDNLDQCLADYQKVLEIDPNNQEARRSCAVLPGEIAERNEKLKTEMMGKLKDLGNLVLRPFGLSTDNFQVVQDPNSGGYSVNFQNNASKEET